MLVFAIAAFVWALVIGLATAIFLLFYKSASESKDKIEAFFLKLGKFADKCDEHRVLVMLAIAFIAIGLRIAFLPILPIPSPVCHDEFSYLLGADTFASGRLTNPTHQLWQFFETEHVLFRPTYASKYPPAQALVMALGRLLGHPWFGVVGSFGVMCAAVYWMARGYLPGRWALLAGLLPLVSPGIASYWCNSYWGGNVAAIGGALVFGACARLFRQVKLPHSALLALGLVILANSRPYEGLVCASMPICGLMIHLLGNRYLLKRTSVADVLVPVCVLVVASAGMLYYNNCLVHDPCKFPSIEYNRQYLRVPLWHGKPLYPEPVYHNNQLRDFWAVEDVIRYNKLQTLSGWLDSIVNELICGYLSLFVGIFLIPLAAYSLFTFKDSKVKWLWASTLAVIVAEVCLHYFQRHYLAPIAGPAYVLLAQGFRHLRQVEVKSRPIGLALSRLILVSCVFGFLVGLLLMPYHRKLYDKGQKVFPRAEIEGKLMSLAGMHLVVVHFAKGHDPGLEYVYNSAIIDKSRIVWARDLGVDKNKQLLEYYPDRRVWVLDVDETPSPRLYTLEQSKSARLTAEVSSDSWMKP